jgi:hypothetical protein
MATGIPCFQNEAALQALRSPLAERVTDRHPFRARDELGRVSLHAMAMIARRWDETEASHCRPHYCLRRRKPMSNDKAASTGAVGSGMLATRNPKSFCSFEATGPTSLVDCMAISDALKLPPR